jgi:two-component system sensor histidine kinase VicK
MPAAKADRRDPSPPEPVTMQSRGDSIAQARLAAIIDSSDDAILSKDLNGIVTSWNAAAARIFGYSAEEMIGTPILKLLPQELRNEEEEILAKIRAGERIDHYETVRMRKNGERVWVAITVSPLRDATGRIIGASKVARDISPQRDAHRTRAILAAIVDSSDDAIISKDLDGVVTSWNPAAARLYGFSAAEMVGQPMLRIIPEELAAEEANILAEIRAGNRIDHYETRRLTRDGREIEVSITVSPIRDAQGRVVGASKIARDISSQRDAQRKKDQFLAVLAHELRNPLAPVRNAISLFGLPGTTSDQRERARIMAERQVQHMARLLDDLLDVSRLANGRVELKKEDVELGLLLAHAVEASRPLIEARGHRFRTREEGGPWKLHADPVRVTQILTNLLSNATKYTDPGGEIELATRREGNEAVVTVSDNGIGFDAAMRARLFTLFAQGEDAASRAAGGLGIGLALVRDFAERHGGCVEAYSEGPGRGSVFTLRLPLAEEKPAGAA